LHTLCDQIIDQHPGIDTWNKGETSDPDTLPIISRREENVPGTHRVEFRSAIDTLELTHTAHNRVGFATGAVLAAVFLKGKKGVYTMREVLGIRD